MGFSRRNVVRIFNGVMVIPVAMTDAFRGLDRAS